MSAALDADAVALRRSRLPVLHRQGPGKRAVAVGELTAIERLSGRGRQHGGEDQESSHQMRLLDRYSPVGRRLTGIHRMVAGSNLICARYRFRASRRTVRRTATGSPVAGVESLCGCVERWEGQIFLDQDALVLSVLTNGGPCRRSEEMLPDSIFLRPVER